MQLITCPHCRVEVAVGQDGQCPSCRRLVADAPQPTTGNPFQSPQAIQASTSAGLTTAEKIYSAIVLLWVGFFLLSLASFHFVLIPQMKDPGVFYFVASFIWLTVLTLGITTSLNLYYRSLLVIPTVLQCAVLCLIFYLLPFGIWGAILLYLRIKRQRTTNGPFAAQA